MGLQIVVYSKLEKMELSEVCLCEDGSPKDDKVTSFLSHPLYPMHMSGLDSQEFYKCNGKMLSFSIGSIEEYVEFKRHLAILAGYKSLEAAINSSNLGFFIEMLRFSETEGTIGPIIAKKLYLDFSDCEKNAKKYFLTKINGTQFWLMYQLWHKSLTYAKENGAIILL